MALLATLILAVFDKVDLSQPEHEVISYDAVGYLMLIANTVVPGVALLWAIHYYKEGEPESVGLGSTKTGDHFTNPMHGEPADLDEEQQRQPKGVGHGSTKTGDRFTNPMLGEPTDLDEEGGD